MRRGRRHQGPPPVRRGGQVGGRTDGRSGRKTDSPPFDSLRPAAAALSRLSEVRFVS